MIGEILARGQQTDGGVLFELGSLLPSIGVGLLFWFVIRAIMRADRTEREAERTALREMHAAARAQRAEGAASAQRAGTGNRAGAAATREERENSDMEHSS